MKRREGVSVAAPPEVIVSHYTKQHVAGFKEKSRGSDGTIRCKVIYGTQYLGGQNARGDVPSTLARGGHVGGSPPGSLPN
jgi:hypothetical protein